MLELGFRGVLGLCALTDWLKYRVAVKQRAKENPVEEASRLAGWAGRLEARQAQSLIVLSFAGDLASATQRLQHPLIRAIPV